MSTFTCDVLWFNIQWAQYALRCMLRRTVLHVSDAVRAGLLPPEARPAPGPQAAGGARASCLVHGGTRETRSWERWVPCVHACIYVAQGVTCIVPTAPSTLGVSWCGAGLSAAVADYASTR